MGLAVATSSAETADLLRRVPLFSTLADIPHTFDVSSDEARFLLVKQPAEFEWFMRTAGEPAASLTIPPPPAEPPDLEALTALAAEYGIEILGPPGIPS